MKKDQPLNVGLISMPWAYHMMPSIQLATLAMALQQEGIDCEVHELCLDYAKLIGFDLYRALYCHPGLIAEWIFSQHYFGPEMGNWLADFRSYRGSIAGDFYWPEETELDELIQKTGDFLSFTSLAIDWSRFDVIGFTLTTWQLGSSMALARLIKKQHPQVRIVFGGASCAGVMGSAILRICPYVDMVVRTEGEIVFPEYVRRVSHQQSIADLPGISWRDQNTVIENPVGELYTARDQRPPLNYDAYFERLKRLGLQDELVVFLPFESSRGCSHGENVQCVFCGFFERMQHRVWNYDHVLAELEHGVERYGITRFQGVDLVIPKTHFSTLLPEIIHRQHDWFIFYETRADLNRAQVELLSKSGVRLIQPGIENLDQEPLRIMRKGITALHAIQLLKWCREMGVRVFWNFLHGFPGETEDIYTRLAERIPLLYHLPAPRVVTLNLQRFSPLFVHANKYGIEILGPHPVYKHLFPVGGEDLNDLVFEHEFTFENKEKIKTWAAPVLDAIETWKAAYARGAGLDLMMLPDGSAEIEDTRLGDQETFSLTPDETVLYLFLDSFQREQTIPDKFEKTHPLQAQRLSQLCSLEEIISRWGQQNLVISENGRVLSLAVNTRSVSMFSDLP